VEEILIPGERSSRKAAENEATGIAIPDLITAELKDLCAHWNVSMDWAEEGG